MQTYGVFRLEQLSIQKVQHNETIKYLGCRFSELTPPDTITSMTKVDMFYRELSWTCLDIFRSELSVLVDERARHYHQTILKPIRTLDLKHCKERCSPCKLVHNTNNCARATFLHVDSSHHICETCRMVECEVCEYWYCFDCNIAAPVRSQAECIRDNLATCKYCSRTFCTSCTDILCKHAKQQCNNCGNMHCIQEKFKPVKTHSTRCISTRCETCNIEHCSICKGIECSVCACTALTVSPNHRQQNCPAANKRQCNCNKRNNKICKNSFCGTFYDTILNDHFKSDPNFKDAEPKQWQKSYWEVAKCFQSPNLEASPSPMDTDICGLISICLNNRSIRHRINNIGSIKLVSE